MSTALSRTCRLVVYLTSVRINCCDYLPTPVDEIWEFCQSTRIIYSMWRGGGGGLRAGNIDVSPHPQETADLSSASNL